MSLPKILEADYCIIFPIWIVLFIFYIFRELFVTRDNATKIFYV